MALKAAKSWVAEMENLHGEGSDQIVADNFTQAECNQIRRLIGSGRTRVGGGDSTRTCESFTLKDLTEFKGKQTKWKTAKQSLHAQLSTMKNEEGVPYAYVIRDNATMTQADIDALPKGTQK
jgi:hypothetical protein